MEGIFYISSLSQIINFLFYNFFKYCYVNKFEFWFAFKTKRRKTFAAALVIVQVQKTNHITNFPRTKFIRSISSHFRQFLCIKVEFLVFIKGVFIGYFLPFGGVLGTSCENKSCSNFKVEKLCINTSNPQDPVYGLKLDLKY